MREQVPPNDYWAGEVAKARERLVGLLRDRGRENEEARKAFLVWKVFSEEAAQRPEDPKIAEERLRGLREIFSVDDSFGSLRERIEKWGEHRETIEGDNAPRISDRQAEIRLIMNEAAVYEEAGFPEWTRETLEYARQEAYQEAEAAQDDSLREQFADLLGEIETRLDTL